MNMHSIFESYQDKKADITVESENITTPYLEDILFSDSRGFMKKKTIENLEIIQERINTYSNASECEKLKSNARNLSLAINDAISVVNKVWEIQNS